MNQDKVFKSITEDNEKLWERLQQYSDDLNLQPEDEKIFTTDDQAKISFYINNYFNNIVSVGVHLARVRKIKNLLQAKRDRLFGSMYVKITDECISGKNSSKYDKEYRTGKVLASLEYKKLIRLLYDVEELEGILESIKHSLQIKANVLPTMFKIDRTQY